MNKKLIIIVIGILILIGIVMSGKKNHQIVQPQQTTVKSGTKPPAAKQSALEKIKTMMMPGEKQKALEEAKQAEMEAQKAQQRALTNANLTPEEKMQKIVNLTTQARTRIITGKYQEAIDMAEEILSLDPDHKEAKILIEKAKNAQ